MNTTPATTYIHVRGALSVAVQALIDAQGALPEGHSLRRDLGLEAARLQALQDTLGDRMKGERLEITRPAYDMAPRALEDATSGRKAAPGDIVDASGVLYVLVDASAPHRPGSNGFVFVRSVDHSTGGNTPMDPSVVGLRWTPAVGPLEAGMRFRGKPTAVGCGASVAGVVLEARKDGDVWSYRINVQQGHDAFDAWRMRMGTLADTEHWVNDTEIEADI